MNEEEIYKGLGFKGKSELEEILSGPIATETKQSQLSVEVIGLKKLSHVGENSDIYSLSVRTTVFKQRQLVDYIVKKYRDGFSRKSMESDERKIYLLSNHIAASEYQFSRQRPIQVFPRYLPDSIGELNSRGLILLEDVSAKRITVEDELKQMDSGESIYWESIAHALDPIVLLVDYFPHFLENKNVRLESKIMAASQFRERFSGSMSDLFSGGIRSEGDIAFYKLSSRYLSCEEKKDKSAHITTVKNKIDPTDNTTLSLIDGSDVMIASRVMPIGSFFGHPHVYNRLSRKDSLQDEVFESYMRRRKDLEKESNMPRKDFDRREFAIGFFLSSAYSNIERAAKLRALAREMPDKDEELKGEIKIFREAALDQLKRLTGCEGMHAAERKDVLSLYAGFAEAMEHAKP